MDTTTGISAPPIGMMRVTPSTKATAHIARKAAWLSVKKYTTPPATIKIASTKFSMCWPEKVTGLPLTLPDNLPKAMIEAVKVIAPMNAPIKSSIFCAPEWSCAGLITAAIAISTADRPTKECIKATSSGILVICTRLAAIEPMIAPATMAMPISQ